MNMKNEALWRIWKHILNSPQVCKSCAKYFDLRNRFWKHEKLMHRTRTRRTFSKHVLHEDQKERGFRNMKDSFLKSWCNFVELSYENKSVSSRLQTHLLQNLKTWSKSPVTWRFLYKYILRDGHIAQRCPIRNWSLFRVLRIVPDLTLL